MNTKWRIHRLAVNQAPDVLLKEVFDRLSALSLQHIANISELRGQMLCNCKECTAHREEAMGALEAFSRDMTKIMEAVHTLGTVNPNYDTPTPEVVEEIMEYAPEFPGDNDE